jgi:23S rRNA (uracil1939-C5)-methyltransferase
MTVQKGQILEVAVDDVAFGGRGITRVDGMAIFVEGAVAGDRVRARVVRRKRSFAEARVVEILEPSGDRVTAPCEYSGTCGGCKWQFLDYRRQLEYKQRHVREALQHIGGLAEVTVHPTIASERLFGYRNKMEFSCSDRRWRMPEELGQEGLDNGFALGLHVPGTFDKVLDTRACLLQPDLGNRILGQVRASMRASGYPPYGLRSHEGFWRFLMLRHSVAQDRWLVNLITAAEAPEAVLPLADRLMRDFPEVAGVVNNVSARRAGIAVGEYEIPLRGENRLRERIGPYEFEVSANSFFQTNTRGAERLYRTVAAFARLSGGERVLDLYSGTGTIAIYLSGQAAEVTGLEIVPSAVADAWRNCQRNGVRNCRFIEGDIRQSLPAAGESIDVLVVDPPRDGMHREVLERVHLSGAARIVYVSCNPATLARDLMVLGERYRVCEIQPLDMFPHTWHIESVARLERR